MALLAWLCRCAYLTDGAPGLESDLPEGEVVEVVELGLSDWCETHRIVVRLLDGSTQRFFTKVCLPPFAFRSSCPMLCSLMI